MNNPNYFVQKRQIEGEQRMEDLFEYRSQVEGFFGTRELDVVETPFGYRIIKGNWRPRGLTTGVSVDNVDVFGKSLKLPFGILYEEVLIIQKDMEIRSHEETDQEVVRNIGIEPIIQNIAENNGLRNWRHTKTIKPGEAAYSIKSGSGFFHGYSVEDIGLLYIAKALNPNFVEGNSFRVPENSYKLQ